MSDVDSVAAELRASCNREAEMGAEKLRTVDASPEYRNLLVKEWIGSLEDHSITLVNRWRKHVQHPDSWTTADKRANN
ncbi:MAG: hypothetical protein V2I48_09525 [Xanthomonadales bacterium]|nr:hypothetical protein [Xanthomonadales bacterium]